MSLAGTILNGTAEVAQEGANILGQTAAETFTPAITEAVVQATTVAATTVATQAEEKVTEAAAETAAAVAPGYMAQFGAFLSDSAAPAASAAWDSFCANAKDNIATNNPVTSAVTLGLGVASVALLIAHRRGALSMPSMPSMPDRSTFTKERWVGAKSKSATENQLAAPTTAVTPPPAAEGTDDKRVVSEDGERIENVEDESTAKRRAKPGKRDSGSLSD